MTRSPINAPKILLMGPGGSGKTYALRTLAAAGVTPFILALDGQGLEAISDIKDPHIHWHNIAQPETSFALLASEAARLGNYNFEGITKAADPLKSKQRRFVDTLTSLSKFVCDRCGVDFGPIDKWGTDRAIVIDHFTELNQAAKEWAVGNKLVLHEGEWQIAMNTVENLVRNLYNIPRCWVIMIAHIDREQDFVMGGSKVMVHALGRKLAPKLNPLFSDVILAVRQGKEFLWDAAAPDVDLKTRNFPIQQKMPPDFAIGVRAWQSRGGIIETEN